MHINTCGLCNVWQSHTSHDPPLEVGYVTYVTYGPSIRDIYFTYGRAIRDISHITHLEVGYVTYGAGHTLHNPPREVGYVAYDHGHAPHIPYATKGSCVTL